MSDWDVSDDETTKKPVAPKPSVKANRWEGEDEDDDGPVVSLLPTFTHPIYQPLTFALIWARGTR